MTAEIILSDSEVAAIFLTAIVGLGFGHSLGTTIAQKFSKHKIRYNLLKVVFPVCVGALALINITNFVNIENNQDGLYWPENIEEGFSLVMQLLVNYSPFIILQIPLMFFIWIIVRMAGRKQEIVRDGFKMILVFVVASIILKLISVEPGVLLIGMNAGFQLASVIGIYFGIKNASNTHLITLIIRWLFGKDILKTS